MGQPQIHKLGVCDRCGGRFGQVTHRWWGHKFCKRACKEAHVRDVPFGREIIRRCLGPIMHKHERRVHSVLLGLLTTSG
jgi:hypothetical protein